MKTAAERTEKKVFKINSSFPTVIFAGGGTGGHLMPAVATAEALTELKHDSESIFLASSRVLNKFKDSLHAYHTIETPELRWLGPASAPSTFFTSFRSLVKTLNFFNIKKPHAVVGMGGWGCAPAVFAARMMRIPTVIFEANAVPGRAVKSLAPFCDAIQLQWEYSNDVFRREKTLPCGTPVKPELFKADPSVAYKRYKLSPEQVTMLVMGGTQGALALNRLLFDALKNLSCNAGKFQVLHITGSHHIEESKKFRAPPGVVYRPIGFEAQMKDAYAVADFALCRAGGGTVAELSALGIPSILVPYPYAVDGHQHKNAKKLADAGGAFIFEQDDLNASELSRIINKLLHNRALRLSMQKRARSAGHPDAANKAASAILELSVSHQLKSNRDLLTAVEQ